MNIKNRQFFMIDIAKIRLSRRRLTAILAAIAVIAGAISVWNVWFSRTYIAFVNFQPISLQSVSQANDNSFIRLFDVATDDIGDLDSYDIVFVNGMGLKITAEQRAEIQRLAEGGTPVYTTMATNPDNNITNLTVDETVIVQQYMMHGGRTNYRNLLRFLRRNIDGKSAFCDAPAAPEEKPTDFLYFPENGDERTFTSVADYERYMKSKGTYVEGGRRIIITGQIADPSDLVKALTATRRYNVYPVMSLARLTDYVAEIRPDAVVNLAHGRLGDDMVEILKANNTLLFDPLTINGEAAEWENDAMGMMGGFLSQSVVTPEIDGAIRTQVLFAQKRDADGLLKSYAIPDRLDGFIATIDRYMALRTKRNGDKRVAVVYFKGPGQAKLVASGLDVVASLYGFLCDMKAQGYRLDGLPATLQEFEKQIDERGSIFNSFAAGSAADFLRNGRPQLVGRNEYDRWCRKSLRNDRIDAVNKAFGDFPGDRNMLRTADGKLAFPRLQYGNVVILPQPMAGEGKDDFRIVHGTDEVPPHSYIAPYLWIQHGFRADALIHFGTHGSLEFTPQKQVALSSADWPDRLVGELPHFYLYTIDNVGEAMTAKRRSYAQIVSHLTPPYHESDLRDTYKELEKLLRDYSSKPEDKTATAGRIKQTVAALGIAKDLRLATDAKTQYSDDDINRIETYAEELMNEKVGGTPYRLGTPYAAGDIRTSVFAMTTDPIAYCRYNIDRLTGRLRKGVEPGSMLFNDTYIVPAKRLVEQLYDGNGDVTDAMICRVAGIDTAQLNRCRETIARRNAPKGMLAMMKAAAKKDTKAAAPAHKMPRMTARPAEPKNGIVAKFMRHQMRKMLAKKDTEMMLEVARKMGASPKAIKKMRKAMSPAKPAAEKKAETQPQNTELALAVDDIERALSNVTAYRRMLTESPRAEIDALMNALNGGFTAPSPGGDPIANPNTLPTGRNLFAINAEETPSEDAWEKGVTLAKNTIEDYAKAHNGEYPRKVSYTLWSGEFIQTGGATIAQVLYMLGVEPVRDRFGRVNDLRLIPAGRLGRPRIDVVVQTSGQLRDLAASRLFLIHRAVAMAAAADDGDTENMVRKGVEESERYLIDKGVSPKEARELSAYRVFGGLNGGYGSGIQGMVEQGGSWNDESEVARQYVSNMGAFYGDGTKWSSYAEEAFAAALTRTDVVVQPRQNNSWGALSLDHVYEFMGGMNLAVRNITGKDPDAYFSDYRNRNGYRMLDSKDAIAVEARTKLFNPSYIKEAMQGGATSTDALAEMVRNTYGWNVMKPKAVTKQMWDEIYDVYVKDSHGLGIHEAMGETNPAAMMEITATMMETARKGYWKATKEQLADIARLHTSFVSKYGPTGSAFEGGNQQLRKFISANAGAEAAKTYERDMRRMAEAAPSSDSKQAMVMERETTTAAPETEGRSAAGGIVVVGIVAVAFIGAVIMMRRKRGGDNK